MDKPYSLSEDMTINQFCGNAPLYTLTKASDDPAENNPLTVEAFLNENGKFFHLFLWYNSLN